MPRCRFLLCISALVMGCASAAAPARIGPAAIAARGSESVGAAEQFAALVRGGRFDDAAARFAPKLRAGLGAAGLKAAWEKATRGAGAFVAPMGSVSRPGPSRDVVYVRGRFEREVVSTKVVLDRAGAVEGLWFLRLGAPADGAAPVPGDAAAVAGELVARMRAGAFLAAASLFDAALSASLLPEQVAEVWETIVAEYGPYQRTVQQTAAPLDDLSEVLIVEQHERGAIDVRVAVGAGRRPVVGLRIEPRT